MRPMRGTSVLARAARLALAGALALVPAACGGGEGGAGAGSRTSQPGVSATDTPGEAGPAGDSSMDGAAGTAGIAGRGDSEAAASPDSWSSPSAPAASADTTGRTVVLVYFSRPVVDGDVAWLESHGIRVDTVMTERTVRGWIVDGKAAAAAAKDARIAALRPLMK